MHFSTNSFRRREGRELVDRLFRRTMLQVAAKPPLRATSGRLIDPTGNEKMPFTTWRRSAHTRREVSCLITMPEHSPK
jgi:hypothetical protein